jgi:hypothetical protein
MAKDSQNCGNCLYFAHLRVLPSYQIHHRSRRPGLLHEIKYDGYRLIVHRDGDRVLLITKGGYDWSKRYPWVVEAALKNRHLSAYDQGKRHPLIQETVSPAK